LPLGRQKLFDPATGQRTEASVYLRGELAPETTIRGPALITEEQTTTVVPAAWQAEVDGRGGILLTRQETTDG